MSRALRIQSPVAQWYSHGWAVERRKGVPDTYEVTYKVHLEAAVVVTRAGWKWSAPNPRSFRRPWTWSAEIYPSWQEAVAAFAAVYRRRSVGRGATAPAEWRPNSRLKTRPWIPKPVHDNFDVPTAESG